MKATYQAIDLLKMAEEDIYETGCQPGGYTFDVSMTFRGKSADDVIWKIAEFVGADNDGILRNSCEEPGRVDFQVLETEDGNPATETDISLWKTGNKRLWAVTYTTTIEKVTTAKL